MFPIMTYKVQMLNSNARYVNLFSIFHPWRQKEGVMFSLYAVILIVFDQCDVALQMDEHVMLCSCGEEETSIDKEWEAKAV